MNAESAPGAIRTRDRRIRNPALYPTELQALVWQKALRVAGRAQTAGRGTLRRLESHVLVSILPGAASVGPVGSMPCQSVYEAPLKESSEISQGQACFVPTRERRLLFRCKGWKPLLVAKGACIGSGHLALRQCGEDDIKTVFTRYLIGL